jgi:hypothetical protein
MDGVAMQSSQFLSLRVFSFHLDWRYDPSRQAFHLPGGAIASACIIYLQNKASHPPENKAPDLPKTYSAPSTRRSGGD